MKGPKVTVALVADLLSVAGILVPFVPLPAALEPVRASLVPVVLAGTWLVYSVGAWQAPPVVRFGGIALVLTAILASPAVTHYQNDSIMAAMAETPPASRHLAALANELREMAAENDPPLSVRRLNGEQNALDQRAKVSSDELVRIFGLPTVPALSVYVPSSDGQLLLPVEGFGFLAYALNGRESIAACAIRLRAIVFWAGHHGATSRIRAWTLSGNEIGKYRHEVGRLHLPDGTWCAYDAASGSDPKNQLVCLPTAPDDTPPRTLKTAALCVATDTETVYLDKRLLHTYLIQVAASFGPYYVLNALAQGGERNGLAEAGGTGHVLSGRPAMTSRRSNLDEIGQSNPVPRNPSRGGPAFHQTACARGQGGTPASC